eukprot:3743395-Heterocapsa_arctica.AAC.1
MTKAGRLSVTGKTSKNIRIGTFWILPKILIESLNMKGNKTRMMKSLVGIIPMFTEAIWLEQAPVCTVERRIASVSRSLA